MIFNDDLIFIHIGKTGGMSCADYLLNNLRPTVYNCHAGAANEAIPHDHCLVTALPEGNRHCTLAEALDFIRQFNGRQLEDFDRVVAVVRNPYALEFSYYQHLRKPHVARRRRAEAKPHLVDLAEGDFRVFAEHSGYHRENMPPETFFTLDGVLPEQLELVKFEELEIAFPAAIASYRRDGEEHPFPHRNKSVAQLTPEQLQVDGLEEVIYRKYRYLFDSGLYQRGEL